MAVVSSLLMSQSSSEGTVFVGYDYDDVTLVVSRLWGRATYLSRWSVTLFNEVTRTVAWSGDLRTTEVSRSLNPQQRFTMVRDSGGASIFPLSVHLRVA